MTRTLMADIPPQHVLDHAECKGLDPRLFFPERGESTREAKAVCDTCPVRSDCLDWAIDTQQKHGIWGGRSERERRRIRAGHAPDLNYRRLTDTEVAEIRRRYAAGGVSARQLADEYGVGQTTVSAHLRREAS